MSIDGSSVLIIELISEDIAKIFEQACDCGSTYSFGFVFVIELDGWILIDMLRFIDYRILD
jgi:hypothetical protein